MLCYFLVFVFGNQMHIYEKREFNCLEWFFLMYKMDVRIDSHFLHSNLIRKHCIYNVIDFYNILVPRIYGKM